MPKNDVLISIIVLTFNSSLTVIETLDSIKEQTYSNIELIITDDGSSDTTIDICRKWLDLNGKYFNNNQLITVKCNTGTPASCNRALNASNGEWIKIIAGDDVLKKECIKVNIKYISTNREIEILQTDADMYIDFFEEANFKSTIPTNFKEFFDLKEGKDQYDFLKNVGYALCTPAIFLKKSIVEKVGGFDERFRFLEDLPLWLNLTKANKKFYYHPVSTVNYRSHDKSVAKDGKKYMNARFAKDALFFQNTYFSKKERNLKVKKNILQLQCLIFLDEKGFNNESILSKLLYSVVNRI